MLDSYLQSHLIAPGMLRADAFDAFMADRERQLLGLIQKATGHQILQIAPEEGEEAEAEAS